MKFPFMVTVLLLSSSAALGTPTYTTFDGSEEFILTTSGHLLGEVRAVTTGDFDHDGDLDVMTLTHSRYSENVPQFILYQNLLIDPTDAAPMKFRVIPDVVTLDPSTFPKVPATWTSFDGNGFDALATADFNNDGWPDLLIGGAFVDSSMAGDKVVTRSILAINSRNSTSVHFVDVGDVAGLTDTSSVCQGVALADFNKDGIVDIFMANTDGINSSVGNGSVPLLFLSTGGVGYKDSLSYPIYGDSTAAWGLDVEQAYAYSDSDTTSIPTHFYAATAGDFDRDGDMDVYVCRRPRADCPYETAALLKDRLYVNLGTQFVDKAEELGADNTGNGYGTCWGDYDNDGSFDLLVANNIHVEIREDESCEEPPEEKEQHNVLFHSLGKSSGYQ